MSARTGHSKRWNLWVSTMLLLAAPALGLAQEATTNGQASDQAIAEPSGSVARAIFTSQIVDREPVDDLATVADGTNQIYFFSELRNLEGQVVTHRWEHDGEVMAEVNFPVGGPRWRVYSSKTLVPRWTGQWTVTVIDENGTQLSSNTFEYAQALAAKQ